MVWKFRFIAEITDATKDRLEPFHLRGTARYASDGAFLKQRRPHDVRAHEETAQRGPPQHALSSLLRNLCAQPGMRCLEGVNLRLDLPPEMPSPLGEPRLAEDFQPTLPVK